MLNTTIKYSLLAISIWGVSACSSPKTITINQEDRTAPRPIVTSPTKRPAIKEEILLGQGAKNPNLGSRVDVPMNNPMLGEMMDVYGDENSSTDGVTISRSEVIERISFPTEEYKYVKKRGRSTVSGKIYLENSHTSLKVTGNKIKLWLNPVTSYSRQWYQESHLGGYKLSKTDARLYNYLKFTYSNNDGKFNFFGVPAGDYYLTGTISCSKECGFKQNKSIRLVREISVGRGVTTVDLMKHVP
jgi:hypothetical protein